MYDPQSVSRADYRKLGGWLMFLNILLIISLVSAACALLGSLVMLVSSIFVYQLLPLWYWAGLGALSAGLVLVCVFALLRLRKRDLRGFRLFMMLYFGTNALTELLSVLLLWFPGHTLQDDLHSFIFYLSDSRLVTEWILQVINRTIISILIALFAVTAIVYIGGAVGIYFYLKRSKRVAIYFDANDVPPPPAYPSAARQTPYPGTYPPPQT